MYKNVSVIIQVLRLILTEIDEFKERILKLLMVSLTSMYPPWNVRTSLHIHVFLQSWTRGKLLL